MVQFSILLCSIVVIKKRVTLHSVARISIFVNLENELLYGWLIIIIYLS